MGFTDVFRYWSILQVVAIILCCRGNASDSTHGTTSATDDRSAEYDDSPNNELETPPSENPIQGDAMHSTQGETSGEDDTNYSSPGSEPNHDEEQTTLKGDEIYPNADKQSKGGDPLGPSTEAESSTDVGQTTKAMSEETPVAGIVICCLIILLVISILVVALYQRRKSQQTKSFGPAAMADVDNRANETDAHATTQGTSQQNNGDHPMALYSVIEETTAVDSEVKQTEATSKDVQSDGVSKDEAKAVVETQTTGLNVYTTVDKPSATASTDSTLETDQVGVKGVADKCDSSPDQVYSLASNDMDSIYAKETAVDSSAPQLDAGAVSKSATPQNDGCQTVIENDLYGKADDCAKETAVESSAQLQAGAVSKPAALQDDGCQTVIENDLYGKADNCAKEIAVESPPSLLLTGL